MFTIELKYIKNFSDFFDETSEKKAILYADFNVINYLYQNNYKLTNPNIIYYPDSTAVFVAINIINGKRLKKLVSTDLLNDLLQDAVKSNRRIYFFGNSETVLKTLIRKLQNEYPEINICGIHNGYAYDDTEVINSINKSGAEILFVGLGVGRQEKWIEENYDKLNCKLIISCGGWFGILSGVNKRAPLWLRKIHLEWFYKLMNEFPRVWKRYSIGVVKFMYNAVTKKIILIIT